MSYLFQTMCFGVLLGHSYSHEKTKENKPKKLFSTDMFLYYAPMLPNLKRKSMQFCSSQLPSLLSNKLRQELLLFLHKDILSFAFMFWSIHDIYPFATVLVKHYIQANYGPLLVTLGGALQSLPLSHYLNSLIAPPKILKESCLAYLSALTRSATVNKSKTHPMRVFNNFQNNVMFMDNSGQRKSSNKLFTLNYSPKSHFHQWLNKGFFSKPITVVFKNYNKLW